VLAVGVQVGRLSRHDDAGEPDRVVGARAPVGREGAAALSRRQLEVVQLVALGATGPEIAAQLHRSHHTVRAHLGARSRAQLVALALYHGLAVTARRGAPLYARSCCAHS
jgi:DNA-binding CsgD family transcriptional regulator